MKRKFVVVLLLLLASRPGMLHAQNGNDSGDTLRDYVDTVTTTISAISDSTNGNDDSDDDVKADEEKKNYFLPRLQPGIAIDSLDHRNISDSQKKLMANDRDFWYANEVFKKAEAEKKEKATKDSSGNGLQTLLWILIIGGFIAALVVYLANSNVGLFRSSKTITTEESDPETDDIFAINYQKEIDKAAIAGNYRLAVRLLFLQLLRNLSDKHLIQYTQEKTNFDYLMQARDKRWYNSFFKLTRHYEYVWYGLFELDSNKYNIIKNDFSEIERQF